jgi:hypothetical protein
VTVLDLFAGPGGWDEGLCWLQTIGLTLEDCVERAALAALRGHEDAVHEQSVLGDYC